jgi:hypothetical protein
MPKRILVTILLLMLVAILPVSAQDDSDEPGLYIPRTIQNTYVTGTRNLDGTPGENYWQNHSIHDISITVDPTERTVHGTQTITYFNNSPDTLTSISVLTYQNIHRPDAIREDIVSPGFITDGILFNEIAYDGKVLSDISVPNTNILLGLDTPLAPSESIEIYFDWEYTIADYDSWKEGAYDETTFFLGLFYPRIAVYDDIEGWQMYPFQNLSGEYYHDFNDYTVEVNVPANFVVWATGDLMNIDEVLQPTYAQRLTDSFTSDEVMSIATAEEILAGDVTVQADTVTWKWEASKVPDFAVALSDHYNWDAASVVVDGSRRSVQSAYNPESVLFEEGVAVGQRLLDYGSTVWPGVPYPYSKMTIFEGGGDEEYPMFANDEDAEDANMFRWVAYHEMLHTWFPFYMGINESRYPFMDEGWTTAFEHLALREDVGVEYALESWQQYRSFFWAYPNAETDMPIITPLDAMISSHIGYAFNPYGKAAMGYLALKDLMGDEAFAEALHEFMARWNGKHPSPWDMFFTFNDVYEEDLLWFFDAWFFSYSHVDLAVSEVQATDFGYSLTIDNVGGMPVPFDVIVTYADGSTETLHQNPGVWQADLSMAIGDLETSGEVSSIIINPGIYPDVSQENNVWEASQ